MKRFVLSAIALSMLALPFAQAAQAGPRNDQSRHEQPRYEYGQDQWKKKTKTNVTVDLDCEAHGKACWEDRGKEEIVRKV